MIKMMMMMMLVMIFIPFQMIEKGDFQSLFYLKDIRCQNQKNCNFLLLYRDACHEAWTNLRLSPMFGCICPNNHMKRRCDKIFNVVNHNPCVGKKNLFDFSFSFYRIFYQEKKRLFFTLKFNFSLRFSLMD